VGRAGVADLHVDLAILTRGLGDHWAGGDRHEAEQRILSRYGYTPDPKRLELYRLIDEFF
jgi:aminoglycoside phosphotransferase